MFRDEASGVKSSAISLRKRHMSISDTYSFIMLSSYFLKSRICSTSDRRVLTLLSTSWSFALVEWPMAGLFSTSSTGAAIRLNGVFISCAISVKNRSFSFSALRTFLSLRCDITALYRRTAEADSRNM